MATRQRATTCRPSLSSGRRRIASTQLRTHAAEAEVTGGAAHLVPLPRGRPVATAVRRRAQVRAALHDPLRVLARRRPGRRRAAAGVARRRRRLANLVARQVIQAPRRARPLPHVADHVLQPEAVGRERPHRRGPVEAERVGTRQGKSPWKVLACNAPPAGTAHPRRTSRRRARRAQHAPTRPPSPGACRPTRRTPEHPRSRRGRPGGRPAPPGRCPARSGAASRRPGTQAHQRVQSSSGTGPAEA